MENMDSADKSMQNEISTTKDTELKMHLKPALGLAIFFPAFGTIILLLIRMITKTEVSKLFLPLIAFPLCILAIRVLFPKKLRAPFGKIDANTFSKNIGFYVPDNLGTNILLGIILGLCTLTGMLIGSLLTRRYVFDINLLEVEQVIFATVPGVWEEVFYRGILMFILLILLKDLKKAIFVQSLIFGIAHIYAFDFWSLVDLFSIFLLGLGQTYVALKTNSLIPSIIFHFLHDAFIFLVQTPDASYNNTYENVVFFASLWIMLGVGMLITKIMTANLNIAQKEILYDLAKVGL